MKANEAPEKIYLFENPITETSDDRWLSQRSDENDIEYTRTDAFINKAYEFLDGCIPDYINLEHANVDTFVNVDNKRFIYEFIKYMKEE